MGDGASPRTLRDVIPAGPSDVRLVSEHLARLGRDNAFDGIPTMPRMPEDAATAYEHAARLRSAWGRGLGEPGWTRSWLLWDGARVVGHVDLHGGRFKTDLHRATLGTGLERMHRGRGHGKLLLQEAIRWASATSLEWIDLQVFAHNLPAVRLYERFGFALVSHIKDRFRFGSRSVDELQMTLQLSSVRASGH